MKQQRASMSKRARFRIFERDSFTCQYCGKQPPEAVLQLDHIHPFSLGGRKSGTLDGGDGALRYISAIMAKRAREDGGR